ncbi:hypothetical protein RvY_16139 [Ramazzottius varieornatus]|uniref:Reverse transcriptase domain-containing protein n=1 Tax=Ramazzottius varieornatus TaxID=947166 RepID=A0A1D1VXE8_RAMVA|nr:hypothetical protein RvY_16139 [Ramazzottius varieornatus]
MKMKMDTKDAVPIFKYPYRTSQQEKEIVRAEVKDMLAKGLIQPSQSPWVSPVLLVKKKDGSVRFCVDYRGLNAVTESFLYPGSRISSIRLQVLQCSLPSI